MADKLSRRSGMADQYGVTLEEMLGEAVFDGVSPGICINDGCDYIPPTLSRTRTGAGVKSADPGHPGSVRFDISRFDLGGIMWNKPKQEELSRLPRLYETDHIDCKDKIIHVHFFIGGCDWYAAEYDGHDRFFGFVNLNDPMNAEWGYFLLSELDDIKVKGIEIDYDLRWQPRKFSEIWQRGVGVIREYFTEQDAKEKVGKIIETLVEFSGVPKGTSGTVIRFYGSGEKDQYGLDVQWHLKPEEPMIGIGEDFIVAKSGGPRVDGFSKSEYERFLKELK